MADNYTATPGLGLLFAGYDNNGVLYPVLLPYAMPTDYVHGVTADIVDTTPVQVIAAPGLLHKIYITHLLVTNGDATIGTFVNITDGNGGPPLCSGYAAEGGGGFSASFPAPLPCSTNTALYAECETTHATVRVTASGFVAK